jgi:hypothetical protein
LQLSCGICYQFDWLRVDSQKECCVRHGAMSVWLLHNFHSLLSLMIKVSTIGNFVEEPDYAILRDRIFGLCHES